MPPHIFGRYREFCADTKQVRISGCLPDLLGEASFRHLRTKVRTAEKVSAAAWGIAEYHARLKVTTHRLTTLKTGGLKLSRVVAYPDQASQT